MLYDSFKFDARDFAETPYGYVFPLTLAAEIVQSYGITKAYKSADQLEKMVREVQQSGRDIPITLEHPQVLDGEWDYRATVGKIPASSLYFDPAAKKVRAMGLINKGNEWLKDMIAVGDERGVSIGFNSKDVYQSGAFDGITYDFKQEDISLDHLAISLTTSPRCPNGVCGFFADAKHKDPEETEELVRIPVQEPSGGDIRTIVISAEQGIKGLVEIKDGVSKVITYLFDKVKWTMEEAQKWIADHKPHKSSADSKPSNEDIKMPEEKKAEAPKVDAPPIEPKADTDCGKKLDALIAEYEKKLADSKASSDAEITKVRDEFQKKFDSLMAIKQEKPEPKEETKTDAKPAEVPAVGEKSVKPAIDAEPDKIDEAKARRLDTYMFKTKQVRK